jgi:hypothetical protein
MRTRTIKHTVTFMHAFTLAGLDGTQPAGSYEVETDEELLEGVSFPVWQRQMAYLRLHDDPERPGVTQTLSINPQDLDDALKRDRMAG